VAERQSKKKTDTQNLGLFKETLSVMFGLHPNTIDRVMAVVSNSEDKLNVKTYITRDKAGPRAVAWLRKAIEYARHEGSAKHEDDDTDFELTKEFDIEQTARDERPRRFEQPQDEIIDMDKPIKECTFRDFLMMEVEISDDPIQGRLDAQAAARNPDRYRKEKIKDNVNTKRDVQQSQDDPHKAEKLRILQRKIQTQKDEEQLSKKTQQEVGAARPVAGMA